MTIIFFINSVVVDSKSSNSKNVFAYLLGKKNFLSKASNEISSAVFHCLSTGVAEHEKAKTVRSLADGYNKQNKDISILGMACKYLVDHAPDSKKSEEIVLPIVAHSFLPLDRVFAQKKKKPRPCPAQKAISCRFSKSMPLSLIWEEMWKLTVEGSKYSNYQIRIFP